jgi:hypothetical protein
MATPGVDDTAQVRATIPGGAVPGTAGQVIRAVQHKDGRQFGNVDTIVVSEPQPEATPEQDAGNRSPESRRPLETDPQVRPGPELRMPAPQSIIVPVWDPRPKWPRRSLLPRRRFRMSLGPLPPPWTLGLGSARPRSSQPMSRLRPRRWWWRGRRSCPE